MKRMRRGSNNKWTNPTIPLRISLLTFKMSRDRQVLTLSLSLEKMAIRAFSVTIYKKREMRMMLLATKGRPT